MHSLYACSIHSYSFTNSFVQSFHHSSIHVFTNALIRGFTHLVIDSFRSPSHSVLPAFSDWLIDCFIDSICFHVSSFHPADPLPTHTFMHPSSSHTNNSFLGAGLLFEGLHRVWPATPGKGTIVFFFEVLNPAEAPLQNFWSACSLISAVLYFTDREF